MAWVVAGTTGLSALSGALGSRSAARHQRRAIQAATQEQRLQFGHAEDLMQPRLQQEQMAMGRVNSLLGLDGEAPDFSTFTDSPGYQFQMDQGQQAIERSAAARGGLQSGNTLAAATQFGQGLADSTFNNYLAQVMGLQNQGTDSHMANMHQQHGANVGNLMVGAGEARASGVMGTAGAISGGLNSLAGQYSHNQTLRRLGY